MRGLKANVGLIWIFFLMCGVCVDVALSQSANCDPNLRKTSDDPLAYRIRGDRCEGKYVREDVTTSLTIASFIESFEKIDPKTRTSLIVSWYRVGTSKLRLRAQSLTPDIHYRMDTVLNHGSNSYVWSFDVLNKTEIKISQDELGVTGTVTLPVGKSTKDVYLPLRISHLPLGTPSKVFRLIVVPGLELADITYAIAPARADGTLGKFVKKDLGYSYYPGGRGIILDIPKPKAGLYYIEIGATVKGGGSASTNLWIYVAR